MLGIGNPGKDEKQSLSQGKLNNAVREIDMYVFRCTKLLKIEDSVFQKHMSNDIL